MILINFNNFQIYLDDVIDFIYIYLEKSLTDVVALRVFDFHLVSTRNTVVFHWTWTSHSLVHPHLSQIYHHPHCQQLKNKHRS